ncbi:MAG: hypothetical protein QMD94_03965 [Candidatus Omnitrophota bacterium]|nr:hypothetical protein [Candidatus Omnitrophota bacterium]
MIKTVQLGKEIVVTAVNKVGVLADMSKIITDQGININAITGCAVNNFAEITLLTNNNSQAADALKKAGYESLKEEEVVIVELENKPGALKLITADLAAQAIDIKHIYGTVCSCPANCPAKIVLYTSDNKKALAVLTSSVQVANAQKH